MPGLAITFCLSFVQAFSVFPSAVLLGAPAGRHAGDLDRRLQAAFEEYDYSMASAIAMIMALVQVLIVVALLALQNAGLSRPGRRRERLSRCVRDESLGERLWATAVWAVVVFFILNLVAMIAHRGGELLRHPLARHLAAGRLDDAAGTSPPGTSSSCRTC